jgi:hypothetical protein
MSDTIGRISVPDPPIATVTFPLRTDYGYGLSFPRQFVTHTFASKNAKAEQRFYLGPPTNRYGFLRKTLSIANRAALAAFWESQKGCEGAFFYDAPQEDKSFVTKTVCFENAPVSFEDLLAVSTVGLVFVEIPDPALAPIYSIGATVTRFPGSTLANSLRDDVQEIIPLIKIRVAEGAVSDIFLSDRRVTVGGQLYLPRLLQIGEPNSDVLVSQSIDGSTDDTSFAFGNADRVMTQLANDTELKWARLELSLYHVGTGIKLDIWAGYVTDWGCDKGAEFTVRASDILSALTQSSPVGSLSRTCWRRYTLDGCPAVIATDTRDLVHFPSADMSFCDLGYDTANGCLAHSGGTGTAIKRAFGGCPVQPQSLLRFGEVNGTGGTDLKPTSQITNSAWGDTIPEIWHDDDGIPQRGLNVNCKILAGREENEFYEALGVVGRGPIGAFTVPQMYDADGDGNTDTFIGPTLDGQPHHGFKSQASGHSYTDSGLGLRRILGNDPSGATEYFSLDRIAGTPSSWREVISGPSMFLDNFAAGVAFTVLRRTDTPDVQLTAVQSHQMVEVISKGLTGLTWSAPGARGTSPGCTNPFWVAVNTLLRALGLQGAIASTQEQYFDVNGAVSAAVTADNIVAKLTGAGTEKQFRFKGTVDARKPTRDWIRDILNNGLGYFTWSFGRLKVGCRRDATPVTTFSAGNVLFNSVRLEPIKPKFEKFTVEFADEEFQFQKNVADYTDQDYAGRFGRSQNPLAGQMGLPGSSTKSQSLRLATIRTREELGGVGAAEQMKARLAYWQSTILALDTEAGMVVTLNDPDVPGGSGKFRIVSWKLKRDLSIDFAGQTVTDSMYDLSSGTVAVDVPQPTPSVSPIRDSNVPPQPTFLARVAPSDSTAVEVYSLSFADLTDTQTISSGAFSFYYYDGAATPLHLTAGVSSGATSMSLDAVTGITAGTFVQIDSEIVLCGAPSGLTVPITRAQLGTAAAGHSSGANVNVLSRILATASFAPGFFSTSSAARWALQQPIPGMTVVAVSVYVTNGYGDSPIAYLSVNLVLDKSLQFGGGTFAPGDTAVFNSGGKIVSGGPPGSGGGSGGTFANFKTLTVDHTKVPNTDQSNFPVLIQGVYSYLAGVAYGGLVQDSSGHDIIFTSDAGGVNRLVFERVVYDTATGNVEFRVRVPSLSHTTDTVFYMWYNNTSFTVDLSTPNAWDSNFVGVYHFGDGATLGRTDSTINHNDNPAGNNGGSLPSATASGQINGGAAFAGGQGYYIGADASLSPSVFTISGWVNIGAASTQAILGATGNGGIEFRVDAGFTLSLLKEGVSNVATSTGTISAGTWKHVGVSYSGTGVCTFYINGVAAGSSTNLQTFTALGKYLGASHNVEDLSNGSKLDEVHFSKVVRSADWIATEYNNSSSPSTFYTVT